MIEEKRIASVPLDGGRHEAVVVVCDRGPLRVAVYGLTGPGMTPSEARVLAAVLVAAAREAEES